MALIIPAPWPMGGFIVGYIPHQSGIGGYVSGMHHDNGSLGGYMLASGNQSGMMGGYIDSKGTNGLYVGGMIEGAEPGSLSGDFYAFYNVIARNAADFDAQISLYKSQFTAFDASAIVYIEEQKPGVNIIAPNIPITSGVAGSTISFEAEASGLNGKNIVFTSWYFTDTPATSGSNNSASGTYTTEHTFPLSGIFDVVFVAIDNAGLISSDRVKIDTTSGVAVPEITLTATPESGVAPLSVGFSGVISSAPYPIVDSYLSFGDGTMSASSTSIYKVYSVVGCYIPVFRVRDSRGFVITDTTVVGVNN